MRGLQISLEVAVIANLLVNLQPVALMLGDDDVVGFGSNSTAVRNRAAAELNWGHPGPEPVGNLADVS